MCTGRNSCQSVTGIVSILALESSEALTATSKDTIPITAHKQIYIVSDRMIPATPIQRIIVIGSQEREPERIAYLEGYFKQLGLSATYVQPTWGTTLTADQHEQFLETLPHSENRPFRDAEKSVFLNFLHVFETIVQEGLQGYSLILESDVLFDGNLIQYCQALTGFLNDVQPEFVSIGSGCDLIEDDVNTEDMNFQIYPHRRVRCMDSYLVSQKGAMKFVEYCRRFPQEGLKFHMPIDNFLEDYFMKRDKEAPPQQYWVWPSLTQQGSQNGTYNSLIQLDS